MGSASTAGRQEQEPALAAGWLLNRVLTGSLQISLALAALLSMNPVILRCTVATVMLVNQTVITHFDVIFSTIF